MTRHSMQSRRASSMPLLHSFSALSLLFATLFLSLLSQIDACGTLLHAEVLRRAVTLFGQPSTSVELPLGEIHDWIDERPTWAQPGSYFPDW